MGLSATARAHREPDRLGVVALEALLQAFVVEPRVVGGDIVRDRRATHVACGLHEVIDHGIDGPVERLRETDHEVDLGHAALGHEPAWLPAEREREFLDRPVAVRAREGLQFLEPFACERFARCFQSTNFVRQHESSDLLPTAHEAVKHGTCHNIQQSLDNASSVNFRTR